MYGEEWWLQNVGQSFFIGLAHLIVTATGLNQVITLFPATSGHDIRWEPARALPACAGAPCTGRGIIVGVVDTGVDISHPDLQGQISSASKSFDPLSSTVDDTDGHGTFIAGLIAARADNGIGIVGVAPDATILSLKEDLQSDNVARAIRYAADHGAAVINLSLGGPFPDEVQRAAIDYATQVPFNAIVVASAGNYGDNCNYDNGTCSIGPNPPLYPAGFLHVVSVGSIDPDGTHSVFSETNSSVDVSAPGGLISSLMAQGASAAEDCTMHRTPYQDLVYRDTYDCIFTDGQTAGVYFTNESGTSFSAQIVAAGAALAKQRWPALTSDQFENLVRSTADLAPGQTGTDVYYGPGPSTSSASFPTTFRPKDSSPEWRPRRQRTAERATAC